MNNINKTGKDMDMDNGYSINNKLCAKYYLTSKLNFTTCRGNFLNMCR